MRISWYIWYYQSPMLARSYLVTLWISGAFYSVSDCCPSVYIRTIICFDAKSAVSNHMQSSVCYFVSLCLVFIFHNLIYSIFFPRDPPRGPCTHPSARPSRRGCQASPGGPMERHPSGPWPPRGGTRDELNSPARRQPFLLRASSQDRDEASE